MAKRSHKPDSSRSSEQWKKALEWLEPSASEHVESLGRKQLQLFRNTNENIHN